MARYFDYSYSNHSKRVEEGHYQEYGRVIVYLPPPPTPSPVPILAPNAQGDMVPVTVPYTPPPGPMLKVKIDGFTNETFERVEEECTLERALTNSVQVTESVRARTVTTQVSSLLHEICLI